MKALLKQLASLGGIVPRGARLIFVSHDISEEGDPTFSAANSTPPRLFRAQLQFLRSKFRFVSLHEVQHSDTREPLASLTFDDGFRTVASAAAPILRELEIPFSIFCNGLALEAARLEYGDEYPRLPFEKIRFYLNADELRALVKEGAGIGSHGYSHRALAGLSEAELVQETAGNKILLEKIVGHEVTDFAFPFGKARHVSPAAVAACRTAGFRRIYSANSAYATRPDPLGLVPRVSLHLQDVAALKLLLNKLALGIA